MKSTKLEAIYQKILTKQEGEQLIASLESFLEKKAAKGGKQKDWQVAVWIERVGGVSNLPKFVEKVKKLVFESKLVTLVLAFEPSSRFLFDVKKWLEENLGEQVLIDLVVDYQLVGGLKIICNNHFRDYSLVSR